MDKETTIRRLCDLTATVAEDHFNWKEPADCFCGLIGVHQTTREKVFEFIEDAVMEKLRKETRVN